MNIDLLTNTQAFGKLDVSENGIERWHPLLDHMIDVAACFVSLVQCRGIRRALERLARRVLTDQDVERLAVLVLLHDIGKANSGFQAKRWRNARDIPNNWSYLFHAGHVSEIFNLSEVPQAYAAVESLISQINNWGASSNSLLMASISHHGRPAKDKPTAVSTAIWKAGGNTYDPTSVLKTVVDKTFEIFPLAFAAGGYDLPDAPAFSHLFSGLVQLADWIGSDTRFFAFSTPDEDRAQTAQQYADTAIATLGLDAEIWRDILNSTQPDFAEVFSVSKPRPIQKAMSKEDLGSLVILESETGSGKTEAALWRFLHLFRTGKVDSLYFALPTRVAATQLYQRLKTTLERVWPENPPVILRALPGYVAADGEEVRALSDFKVLWNDSPNEQVAHRRWSGENAKRFLAAPIAVGTIDQALMGILQVSHAHLRQATLSRSLLVVDEVHASDAYMTVLLERLLKFHMNCGGQALLLSATLGSSARDRYMALVSSSDFPPLPNSDFTSACMAPYPSITDQHGMQAIKESGQEKKVCCSMQDIIDAPDQVAQLALAAAAQGAKVLVIRNTVPAAVATLKAIESATSEQGWLFSVNDAVSLHHSRFSREDRPLLDAAIQAQMGKGRAVGALIVVGTQTLEQSLDIDADYLITDLCPMDVLLQRIGRLHRHASNRPAAYAGAQAVILTPSNHDLTPMLTRPSHGLGRFRNGGGVYDDLRIVEATRRLIVEREEIHIPADNRYLVEGATHPDQLEKLCQELGEHWQALSAALQGDIGAERSVASLHVLDVEKEFGEDEFPEDVSISTRLGSQDRLVNFEPPLSGPFGKLIKTLPIRSHMLPQGLSLDAEATAVTQQGGVVEFALGNGQYRYSRYGLERLSN
ncbi:MAG: CRISPR-associated helicase Cas3' [Burkholderiaceae bacterium]|nr:CRISPR-associated helicase Cas3' [Burkholderiaceae bacterium]